MPGHNIEREARYTMSGLTAKERDDVIIKLRAQGWTQKKIARFTGMTQPGVKYAIDRVAGKPRKRSDRLERCDMCDAYYPPSELECGMCLQCEQELTQDLAEEPGEADE